MAQPLYSHRFWKTEETIEVPPFASVSEALLDERHLSKSALRALDVLEFFGAWRRPARAVDVARALGLSASSADQLLKTLVSHAYLIFHVRTKLYHPSPRLLGFANLLGSAYFGDGRLRALMTDLAERTGRPVALCTPFDRSMQLVDVIAPPGEPYKKRPGFLFPLFDSAAGAAILATWPVATVRELIGQSQDQLGPLAAEPAVILDALDEVRASGHAFGGLTLPADEECSIAVALPHSAFGADLALSLRGPLAEMKARRWRLAAAVQEAVAAHLGSGGASTR